MHTLDAPLYYSHRQKGTFVLLNTATTMFRSNFLISPPSNFWGGV